MLKNEKTKEIEMELLKQEELLKYVKNLECCNEVCIAGKMLELQYMGGNIEGIFYKATVMIKRNTEIEDKIPVIIPKNVLGEPEDISSLIDSCVKVIGELRTMNYQDDKGEKHTCVFVYAVKLKPYKNGYEKYINTVNLKGIICKNPIYRITPSGKEIADIIIAVKSGVGQSSYIFCIAWREYAEIARELKTGTKITVYGYIHSRPYTKRIGSDYEEKRTAYEVSIKFFREEEELVKE